MIEAVVESPPQVDPVGAREVEETLAVDILETGELMLNLALPQMANFNSRSVARRPLCLYFLICV